VRYYALSKVFDTRRLESRPSPRPRLLTHMYRELGCGHRCTQVENQGEGVPEVFVKIAGGQGFQEKFP
jgi:hypothetical protein